MRYFEQVEAYVEGRLTGEDLIQFERELAISEELKREVDLARMTELVMDTALKEELAAEIKSIRGAEGNNKEETKVRRLRLWIPLSIAASIALMVGIFFPYGSSTDGLSFADNAYQEYMPNFSNSRGEATANEEIANLLISGQAAEAEQLILASDTPNRYLLAHSLMMQSQYEEAVGHFQFCLDSSDYGADEKSASEFYMALCYFGQGELEKGKAALEMIRKNPAHPFTALAEKLLHSWED